MSSSLYMPGAYVSWMFLLRAAISGSLRLGLPSQPLLMVFHRFYDQATRPSIMHNLRPATSDNRGHENSFFAKLVRNSPEFLKTFAQDDLRESDLKRVGKYIAWIIKMLDEWEVFAEAAFKKRYNAPIKSYKYT